MTTSQSSEAIWNFKKYVWTSIIEEIKIFNVNQWIYICIFTFLLFVDWLTDLYGEQNIEKESIKIKEKKNHETFSTISN